MKILEWRNQNKYIDFPFEKGNLNPPTDVIIDAALFINQDCYLTAIERINATSFCFTINDQYKFYYLTSAPYAFNDYGKLVIDNLSYFTVNKIYTFNAKFLDTIIYTAKPITFMNLASDLTVKVSNEETLTVSLPETDNFTYDCVQSMNSQESTNFVLGRDACVQLDSHPGKIHIVDACKAPCYDCDNRLLSGDMHQMMTSLESRLTVLENSQITHTSKSISFEFENDSEDTTFEGTYFVKSVEVHLDVLFTDDRKIAVTGIIADDVIILQGPITDYTLYIYEEVTDIEIVFTGESDFGKGIIIFNV